MRSLKTALGQFCPTREDNNCCAKIATMLLAQLALGLAGLPIPAAGPAS